MALLTRGGLERNPPFDTLGYVIAAGVSDKFVEVDSDSTPEEALLALTQQAYAPLLQRLPPYRGDQAAELNTALRSQGWPAPAVAAALTQSRLRQQALAKFGQHADTSLYTDTGLQQATRSVVAQGHAERFRSAGITRVLDLGCGLGADALAFAEAGLAVEAVEADPLTAALAAYNLRDFPQARVHQDSAEQFMADFLAQQPDTASAESQRIGIWLDPARRVVASTPGKSAHRRLWNPDQFTPSLDFGFHVAARGFAVGMKLGPGTPHELIPAETEAQWVSVDGDAVELCLWFGPLRSPGRRRTATVLRSAASGIQRSELSSATEFDAEPPPAVAGAEGVRHLIYEPDPAVIRAQLITDLCREIGGYMLDEHIAYFGSDSNTGSALARRYRVLEVFGFSESALRQWAAENQVQALRIKKRGVDIDIPALRRRIMPRRSTTQRHKKESEGIKPAAAQREHTLIITRLGQDRIAVHVQPLDDALGRTTADPQQP